MPKTLGYSKKGEGSENDLSEILIKKPTYAQLLQENSKLKKELDELKQKLQFLWGAIPLNFNLDSGEAVRWRDWLKKFEELLKEEKEAKP